MNKLLSVSLGVILFILSISSFSVFAERLSNPTNNQNRIVDMKGAMVFVLQGRHKKFDSVCDNSLGFKACVNESLSTFISQISERYEIVRIVDVVPNRFFIHAVKRHPVDWQVADFFSHLFNSTEKQNNEKKPTQEAQDENLNNYPEHKNYPESKELGMDTAKRDAWLERLVFKIRSKGIVISDVTIAHLRSITNKDDFISAVEEYIKGLSNEKESENVKPTEACEQSEPIN